MSVSSTKKAEDEKSRRFLCQLVSLQRIRRPFLWQGRTGSSGQKKRKIHRKSKKGAWRFQRLKFGGNRRNVSETRNRRKERLMSKRLKTLKRRGGEEMRRKKRSGEDSHRRLRSRWLYVATWSSGIPKGRWTYPTELEYKEVANGISAWSFMTGTFNVVDTSKPLLAVGKLVSMGHKVEMNPNGKGWIILKDGGRSTIYLRNGGWKIPVWIWGPLQRQGNWKGL